MNKQSGLPGACVAEFAGTFFLVLFGVGSVFVAVLTGALQGLFQVAVVWGIVIALCIHATSAVSGAHLNPAVTLACWAWRSFPRSRLLPYMAAQLAGAFVAAAALYALFNGIIAGHELEHGIARGLAGSERTAMLFGEYFPHPLQVGADASALARVSPATAMLAEASGTAILVFFIFALTDPRNPNDAAREPHELTHLPDSLRAFCAGRPIPAQEPIKQNQYQRDYADQIDDFMSYGR